MDDDVTSSTAPQTDDASAALAAWRHEFRNKSLLLNGYVNHLVASLKDQPDLRAGAVTALEAAQHVTDLVAFLQAAVKEILPHLPSDAGAALALDLRNALEACQGDILGPRKPAAGGQDGPSTEPAGFKPGDADLVPTLLIDDDKGYCELLRHYLIPLGYLVSVALDYKTGMRRLDEQSVTWGLVIADQNLLGWDGRLLLQHAKKVHPEALCFLCASTDFPESGPGIDASLSKPQSFPELAATINRRYRGLIRLGQIT